MISTPNGALFDWDGVIVDSSAQHEESWERLSAETGLPLFEGHFRQGFGRKNQYIIPHMLKWTQDEAEIARLSARKEALYRQVVAETHLHPLPGVSEWLTRLHEAEIPCAIGSSTPRANIDFILPRLGLERFFSAIITAENVSHGKPHPEVFQKAAAALGREPSACVVFEDAFVGIEAARAAGARVVAVATTHTAQELQPLADFVVHRMDELTPAQLWPLV